MNDVETMFNRKVNPMQGTLPLMPEPDFDPATYGYNTGPDNPGQYNSSSSSSYSTKPGPGGTTVSWDMQSPVLSPNPYSGMPPVVPTPYPPPKYPYEQPSSSTYPPTGSSCMYVNPWQLGSGNAIEKRQDINTLSPPLQSLPRTSYPSYNSNIAGPSHSMDDAPSAGSVDPDSWEPLSPDNEVTDSRLTAEDMADDDELAELREIEQGGASRSAERRRMRNKLAQRAFRARAKVVKTDAASRLVEAETSNSTQNRELDMLRTMVHTLQTENTQLKRQIKDSNNQHGPGDGAPRVGVGVGEGGGKVEQEVAGKLRKRGREAVLAVLGK